MKSCDVFFLVRRKCGNVGDEEVVNFFRVILIKNFWEEMEFFVEISKKLYFCGNFFVSEIDIKKRSLLYFFLNYNFKN